MIYLDNNATTQIAPQVCDAMLPFLGGAFGNPSSAYTAGREARVAVENARESVAKLLQARASEIAFTSGGTESDNWAIHSALKLQTKKKHIVSTRVEHEAVRKVCEELERDGYEVTWLDVDSEGALDLSQLRRSVRRDTALVSVMWANNETGILFPIKSIAEIVRENSDALIHVDAVNAVGKIPVDLSDGAIDLLSLSAHKFHGPKGVGALFIRDGILLPSASIGGGQESGRRAGTEAVHQIAGLGAGAELVRDLTPMEGTVRQLRDKLESAILSEIPGSFLNGTADSDKRLPNTSSISFENVNGEAILAALDAAGVCVSTGSACHAGDHQASPVLQAMNVPYSRAMGSIRFSLGRYNTETEVEKVRSELKRIVGELRRLSG